MGASPFFFFPNHSFFDTWSKVFLLCIIVTELPQHFHVAQVQIQTAVQEGLQPLACLLTAVQHGCLVLLALSNDNDTIHLNVVEHFAHHVYRSLVCCIFVALAKPADHNQRTGTGILNMRKIVLASIASMFHAVVQSVSATLKGFGVQGESIHFWPYDYQLSSRQGEHYSTAVQLETPVHSTHHLAAASAAASVTRTSSRAKLRDGAV